MFFLLLEAMSHTEAAERLHLAQAVAHGAAMAMNGKDAKVKNHTRMLARAAYPEVSK